MSGRLKLLVEDRSATGASQTIVKDAVAAQKQNRQDREFAESTHSNGTVTAPQTSSSEAKPAKPWTRMQVIRMTAITVVTVLAANAGFNAYKFFASHEETDDATITGHIHVISSRVPGNVLDVLVDDNQHVKKGQVVARLDSDEYDVRVAQAKAALGLAQRQAEVARMRIAETTESASAQSNRASGDVSESQASLDGKKEQVNDAEAAVSAAQAHLTQAQATLENTRADYQRYSFLERQGAVSTQLRDTSKRDLSVAEAGAKAAREQIKQAQSKLAAAQQSVTQAKAHIVSTHSQVHEARASLAQVGTARMQYEAELASVQQAEAKLNDAMLQKSYTTIVAPVEGTIGRKNVEVGQRLQASQQIMAIVPDDVWVVANFKETQLQRMDQNQTVELKVDAFPDHVFKGHVDSRSPASGSQFALLPPDNATGNFTKIVQRVPVKIVFDNESIRGYERVLAPGMSVIATVSVSSTR